MRLTKFIEMFYTHACPCITRIARVQYIYVSRASRSEYSAGWMASKMSLEAPQPRARTGVIDAPVFAATSKTFF